MVPPWDRGRPNGSSLTRPAELCPYCPESRIEWITPLPLEPGKLIPEPIGIGKETVELAVPEVVHAEARRQGR
jgi:hypothetical protein